MDFNPSNALSRIIDGFASRVKLSFNPKMDHLTGEQKLKLMDSRIKDFLVSSLIVTGLLAFMAISSSHGMNSTDAAFFAAYSTLAVVPLVLAVREHLKRNKLQKELNLPDNDQTLYTFKDFKRDAVNMLPTFADFERAPERLADKWNGRKMVHDIEMDSLPEQVE